MLKSVPIYGALFTRTNALGRGLWLLALGFARDSFGGTYEGDVVGSVVNKGQKFGKLKRGHAEQQQRRNYSKGDFFCISTRNLDNLSSDFAAQNLL